LIEQLQPQLVAGGLSASVLQLSDGADVDALITSEGPTGVEGLLASARHWLYWRLELLLAPWPIAKAAGDLNTLQQIEARSRELLKQLPDGALRHAAREQIEQTILGSAPLRAPRFPEPPPLSSRQRAERRALQLLIHAPKYRDLLLCLPIHDPGCRAAMDWAANVALATNADHLPQALLKVAEQLSDGTGALLLQFCKPAPEVLRHLQRNGEAEMQQVMDLLEPK